MHRALAFLMIPVLLTTAMARSQPSQSSRQMTVGDVVRHSRDAVVQVVVSDQSGNEISLGSGFIVSADGKVVTNYHVIEGAHSGIAKLADGTVLSVEGVLAVDTDKDLAILKVEAKRLPFLKVASTHDLQVGDHVVAIGSPLGLEGTVSDGIVSALREEAVGKDWIQTTVPVSHGNSGGPLLNMSGSVVGVITLGVSGEKGQNLNFAIPADEVKSLLSRSAELVSFESIDESRQRGKDWRERSKTLDDQGRYSEEIALLQQACDGGDMAACGGLGYFYFDGKRVSGDYEQARSLFEKACNGGDQVSCLNLGALYSMGMAPEWRHDNRRAFIVYQKSCDAGYMGSCSGLANLYANGLGVARDSAKALALYNKACDAGEKVACINLGTFVNGP